MAVCYSNKKSVNSKAGHSKGKQVESKIKWLATADKELPAEQALCTVGTTESNHTLQVKVKVNGQPLEMELDTGAAVSVLPEEILKIKFPQSKLQPSTVTLKTYSGEVLESLGELPVTVQYEDQKCSDLAMIVVKGDSPCLFGRNWLQHFQLDWKQVVNIGTVTVGSKLDELLEQHREVFSEGLGTIHPFEVKLAVKGENKPKFCHA